MIIRCYETPEGRVIELNCRDYSLLRTDRGNVRILGKVPLVLRGEAALEQYHAALEEATTLDFEATWASHFEGVPYAPGDRTEA